MKPRKTSLEMEDEIDLHQKGWLVQRVGWAILALLLIAASLGLFGNGILSKRFSEKNNIQVSYEHFCRYEASVQLRITATEVENELRVEVPQSYLRLMEIDKIVPQPRLQKIQDDHLQLVFDAQGLADVTIHFNPKTTGNLNAKFRVNESNFLISHFIYP